MSSSIVENRRVDSIQPEANLRRSSKHMWWLIGLCGAIRLVTFLLTQNQAGDADARALIGCTWALDPRVIHGGLWLPLHFYIIGFSTLLFGDPVFSAKLPSLIAGTLSIIPFYRIVSRCFSSQVAVISGILFCFCGLHINLSAVSLSEAVFVFPVLLAFDLLLAEVSTPVVSLKRLYAVAFCLAIAGYIRSETILLIGVSSFFLLKTASLRKHIIPFVLLSASTTLFVAVENYFNGVGFLYAFTGVDVAKQVLLTDPHSKMQILIQWAKCFLYSPGPLVVIACLYGLWKGRESRVSLSPAGIGLALILPYFVMSMVRTGWEPQPRYFVFSVMMLLPYAALGIHNLASLQRGRRVVLAAFFVLTIGYQALYYNKCEHSSRLFLPVADRSSVELRVSEYLRNALKPGDRIWIEDYDFQASGILLRSGGYKLKYHQYPHYDGPTRQDRLARIRELRPTLIVLGSQEAMSLFDNLDTKNPVVQYGKLRIYRGGSAARK